MYPRHLFQKTKTPLNVHLSEIPYLYSSARISSLNPQNPNHTLLFFFPTLFHLASSATPNNPRLLKTRVSGEDGWRQHEEVESRREFGG